jgi:Ca-activated chloride channel family protein
MKYCITIILLSFSMFATAQRANNYIKKGNDAYRKSDFNTAVKDYENALKKDPENSVARFNLANTLQRQNNTKQAIKNYDEIIADASLNSLKAECNYNKGLSYIKEKDLLKAIESFKAALKQNANDDDARENLQKALNELNKQQNSKPRPNKQQQDPKQKKQTPLNKEMMLQKLNELRNQEKLLQQKLQSKNNTLQPEIDW